MNKEITDVITSYKSRSIDVLRDQQCALTPCIDPYIIEKQVFEYNYNTHRTLVGYRDEACFRCHYMYLKHMNPRKYMKYSVSKEYIAYLVTEEVIDPFLFFVNGKLVPWSMIKIIITHNEYYILCQFDSPEWFYEFNHVKSLNIIHLPDGCVYKDTPVGDDNNKIFGFDEDGCFTADPDCPISIINKAPFMKFNKLSTVEGVNAYAVCNDNSIKYYPNNVILFRNHKLDTTSDIQFVSTLLTVDNGLNKSKDQLDLAVFRDSRVSGTADNIKDIYLPYMRFYIEQKNKGNNIPSYVTDLQEQFNFEMSRKKDYSTNIDESIDYIVKYNSSLLEDVYLQDRNLFVEEKTGQWVLDNINNDGTLRIPRKHGKFTDEYILMLVNGILYKFYYMIKYTPGHCIIPIKDIEPEDIIEFLRFDDINNNIFDITVNEDDEFIEYDKNYINSDMILFSTVPPTNDFEFPEDGLQHFPIDYTLEYDDSGKCRIRFEDTRYYGQNMKLVYKHQFKHYWFDINSSEVTDSYRIDLGTKFMYCNDYSKYLVFFNGRRLSTDQYRLCLPVRSTTPFSRFEIYLSMYVDDGDRIDVIYTPSLLKDILTIPEIEEDGNIVIDKSDITYGLSKDLYMVWANGKKIAASQIENIDSTRIRIVSDIQTLKSVCITKFLPDIDELTEVFQTSTVLWDHIMSQLSNDDIATILNYVTTDINDTEVDIYANNVHIRSVMLELIRDKYMMNTSVDITQPFVYDYLDVDTTAISGYDSGNNILLDSGDANITENIDGIERNWP